MTKPNDNEPAPVVETVIKGEGQTIVGEGSGFANPTDSVAPPPSIAPLVPPSSGSGLRKAPASSGSGVRSSGSGVRATTSSSGSGLRPVPGAATEKTQMTPQPSSSDSGLRRAGGVAKPEKTPAPVSSGSGVQKSSGGFTNAERRTKMEDPEPGTRLHHYEIIKLIGRGGMGSVFLGRDTRLGRRVAIKFLRTQSPELTKRFVLEARTTAACSHENIVTIFEVDAWQSSPFMVFEFLAGQTLTKFIPEAKPLAPPRAVELMVPVVRALAYAHSQGIVHRDLKPDNILITDAGITKVLDFGIAKVLQGDEKAGEEVSRPRAPKTSLEDEDDEELTRAGAMMGTLAYMAPEQWGIGVPIDHRADIWAVGIMLFRMLAGKHPLAPLSGHQLMITGVLTQGMPTLESMAPEVPKELAAIVDKCLMKYKDERWPDAVTLLRALEPYLPGRYTRELKLDESPYAGLSSFQEADADRFFGRRQEIASLVNRLRERPLIGVVGPSGAGKSSFVRAGLVPALKRSGEPWEAMVLRPGRSPLAALANLVSPLVGTSASVADELIEQKKLTERIAAEPGFVGAVLRARARKEKKNILLFVDQFEELYTLVADAAERTAFTSALTAVADDATTPIRLVLSIRSDFLDRVPEDPRFMAELSQGLLFLSAPGAEGLREAIVQPAEMAGYKFETAAIVEDMLHHLATTQGALPLLQFAAAKLWENRDPAKKQLTRFGYEAIGGVAGALASHADAVLAKVPPQSVPLVRSILLRLVTPERTRAIISLEELRELSPNQQDSQRLIDELVNARLLVVQVGAGAATVEIVHESLIHSWPTLKRWLEENGEDAAFLDEVRSSAKQWFAKGRPADLLWRGELADEALRFQKRHRGPLSDVQTEFLNQTIALGQKAVRRRRQLVVGGISVLSLLVAASLVALVVIQSARSEAVEQSKLARAAEAAATANLIKAQESEAAAKVAETAARKAADDLKKNQADLLAALKAAEDASKEAKRSEEEASEQATKAKLSAAEANQAKIAVEAQRKKADELRKKAEDLANQERERAERLRTQLGSPVIDELK